MKRTIGITVIALLIMINSTNAQNNPAIINSSIPIEMLFPQGKSKALILSFDDGMVADRKLVKLMNEYGLVGTFHLNSNKLGTKDYLTKEEIINLYKGHEVSGHTSNHPSLTTLSKIDVIYEVLEDRKELERLAAYPVRGMSYPFGNTNDFVIEAIRGLGIEYARTVGDTYNFSMPVDFLKWQPTIHLFGKTNYIPNDTANDKRELGQFYRLTTDFLKANSLALFYVWGHSWEYEEPGNKWAEVEKFFKMVSQNPEIYYTMQIGLVDYLNAFKNLKFSVDKDMVTNLSSIDVFVKINGKVFTIEAG
ncbi:MAG: polysaccharide deacetylase family protein, partial [Bacteroidales bacterium]|nr:polysaccharide deacetylase family protein [Bacteroidales bacterium]